MSGAGTITLDGATLGADVTTVGGAINFSGAVTADQGGSRPQWVREPEPEMLPLDQHLH